VAVPSLFPLFTVAWFAAVMSSSALEWSPDCTALTALFASIADWSRSVRPELSSGAHGRDARQGEVALCGGHVRLELRRRHG